ncbi:glycoside hydrolase family 18 protein, partial [Lederbergia lenta]
MKTVTNSNKKKLRLVGLSLLLIFSLLLPSLQAPMVAAANDDYKVVGYYTAWAPPENLDINKVTHLNYAFADVCWEGMHGNPEVWAPEGETSTWPCRGQGGEEMDVPNGTVVLGDPKLDTDQLFAGDTEGQPFAGNLNQLVKFKKQNPKLKTLISIGGWSWSVNISHVAASQETREVFAKSAAEFVQKYQMDGVDLDWEFPVEGGMWNNNHRPEDKENHTLLLAEVRKALDEAGKVDGKEYLLTIASSVSFSYVGNNELDKIAEIVDFINIMTYDFNGGWATTSAHNAPLYEDEAASDANVHPYNIKAAISGHLNAGVPANKLVMGLPFYGRSWGECNTENDFAINDNGGYQNCAGAGGGNVEPGVYTFEHLIAEKVNKNGYTRYWNDNAKVPFLYNDENGEFISYDDVESMGHKVDFIKETGLAGAMIWEIGQDDKNSSLLSKVSSDLGISSSPPPPVDPSPENPSDTEEPDETVKPDET